MSKTIKITTSDQVRLYLEQYGEHHKTLIINPAIGVKRSLYRTFAEFLSAHGVTTVLYNYRGMEDGVQDIHDGVKMDAETWGRLNQSAVIDWVHREYGPHKLFLLGHSIGGQIQGFSENLNRVDGLVHVAAQKGDKKYWPLSGRFKLWLVWHVLVPLMSRGQTFAAKKLGLGAYPWPSTAARQWASWGQNQDYLFNPKFGFDLSGWHHFNRPILSLGFTDDDMAPEAAIDGLMEEFGKPWRQNGDLGHIEKRIIDPQNLGLKSIGHFGFFKPEAEPLWQDTVKWVQNN